MSKKRTPKEASPITPASNDMVLASDNGSSEGKKVPRWAKVEAFTFERKERLTGLGLVLDGECSISCYACKATGGRSSSSDLAVKAWNRRSRISTADLVKELETREGVDTKRISDINHWYQVISGESWVMDGEIDKIEGLGPCKILVVRGDE